MTKPSDKPPEPKPRKRKRAKFNPKPKPPKPEPPLLGGLGQSGPPPPLFALPPPPQPRPEPKPKRDWRVGTQDSAKPITRRQMLLLRRADRENWGVPDRLKTEGLLACYQVLIDPDSGRRAKMAAVRVLQQVDANDLVADRLKLLKVAATGADTTHTLAELVRDMVHAGGKYEEDD